MFRHKYSFSFVLEKTINQGKPVGKFASFSATLENEIHLSFSCYGASGKAAGKTWEKENVYIFYVTLY